MELKKSYHHIRIHAQAKADLSAWLLFLQHFNGKAFFLSDQWLPAKALHLYTDAAGSVGYGAVLGGQWFYGIWPENWVNDNITLKEFFPIIIVTAVRLWALHLANQRIMLHTDNLALVHIINSTTSKEAKSYYACSPVCRLLHAA